MKDKKNIREEASKMFSYKFKVWGIVKKLSGEAGKAPPERYPGRIRQLYPSFHFPHLSYQNIQRLLQFQHIVYWLRGSRYLCIECCLDVA